MLLKKIYFILSMLVFTSFSALAQQTKSIEMADAFRADGKIYVVITVVAIILIGLLVYLISLDKKIGKMEKEYNEKN
jgi:uncharacterized membrane protein YiaA